jgi:O-antigen biosynthesis protein
MKVFRFAGTLALLLLSLPILICSAALVALLDLIFAVLGARHPPIPSVPQHDRATIVIPNWNGRSLLEKYLPGVIAAVSGNAGNEVIIVDNGSSDGSAAFVESRFPQVRLIRCKENRGFGGGSNLGVRNARNDIVVLLNNDMRVEADFLSPLLEPFADPCVFSVTSQIFFSDPSKLREETGLTQGWWEGGRLRVTHRHCESIQREFPCFYGGGGSSAYDRRKFLELGGFDSIFQPLYYEDTDLGFMAWKRGWKVLYQPRSIVHHEHRGTAARKFSEAQIQITIKKNNILFSWKNIHDWRLLAAQFPYCFASSLRALLRGDAPGAFSFAGLTRAFLQIPAALAARWHAWQLATVPDLEAFRRSLGSFFRDRFELPHEPLPERLRVLFAAPYAIEPPVHGGAVLMKLTLEELSKSADVHLIGMVDRHEELQVQQRLSPLCASMFWQVRRHQKSLNRTSLKPHAIRVFEDRDFEWALHRTVFERKIDAIQLEYTQFAQYAAPYQHIPVFLFEHDIYFQSIRRQLKRRLGLALRVKYWYEYFRALRYERLALPKMTRVQVCSAENAEALLQLSPRLRGKIDSNLRAGIQINRFPFRLEPREPDTMLFVGSFRHNPNVEGLLWFVTEVLPRVTAGNPQAVLVVVGADAPTSMLTRLNRCANVNFSGYVEDIHEPLGRYSTFVCPILSGSGIRVKLLEAFATGIPVISTSLGAEGLARDGGPVCEIADTPDDFAAAVLRLLASREYARQLANRARQFVESEMDGAAVARRLLEVYRRESAARRIEAPRS